MDDEFGADDDLLEAMATVETAPPKIEQPAPQRIQQPTPQRLDNPPPQTSSSAAPRIIQPTPQSLPSKSGSTILVSPRQRGNPILTCIRSVPWEYSDILADYVLGLTTCALFLSLKYHRLHPEYIYTRIQNLQGKYQLRVLLTMVDIANHEDSVRELSKTSMVNNVTVILCWSAAEAGRYLELYKSFENVKGFEAIRGQQSNGYADRLVEFVTVPRSLNKSDAVALVANFGSLRNAVNAEGEQLGMIGGWGGVKVGKWMGAVEAPFRVKKAGKRGVVKKRVLEMSEGGGDVVAGGSKSGGVRTTIKATTTSSASGSGNVGVQKQFHVMGDLDDDDEDDEEAMLALAIEESKKTARMEELAASQRKEQSGSVVDGKRSETDTGTQKQDNESLSGGVAAALEKLRQGGG